MVAHVPYNVPTIAEAEAQLAKQCPLHPRAIEGQLFIARIKRQVARMQPEQK